MSMKHSRKLKQCNDRNQLNVVTARARARERETALSVNFLRSDYFHFVQSTKEILGE